MKISASAINYAATSFEIGMTVYRSNGLWDGGSGGQVPYNGFGEGVLSNHNLTTNTPHVFNATDNIGRVGTGWMTNNTYSDSSLSSTGDIAGGLGNNSNMTHTLGYVNSGQSFHATDTNWGEDIQGAFTGHTTGTARNEAALFSNGMTGAAGGGQVMLTFANLAAGDYTIFIGGSNSSAIVTSPDVVDLSISLVPLPGAVWMMGTGLIGLVSIARKKRR